jgi:hypothetical protein
MFLEKFHRFIRHYRFSFAPRKQRAISLPLVAPTGKHSVFAALEAGIRANKALDVRPNGDIIEMMDISVHKATGAIVALLHRASPNAADPMYRRKARAGISVRTVDRKADEDQSVSAHLIILPKNLGGDTYDALLEEIPGLSMSLVQPVIGKVLRDYEYGFKDDRGKEDTTYPVFKPRGVKSETVSNALKTGNFGYITLSKPADAPFIDSGDIFEARDEKMKIRIKGHIEPKDWIDKIGQLALKARKSGWDNFQVDIELDDDRMKRISIARGEEAKEVLFIRSLEVNVKTALPVCSTKAVDEFIKAAVKAI